MENKDWIRHHEDLGEKETDSAKYNGFVYEKSTQAYRRHIRQIIRSFEPRSVMDLCCGSGDVTGSLTDKFKVFGVDAVKRSCELASQNGLEVKCCKLEDYKVGRKFDLILCCEAIYLLDNPEQVFEFFQNFSTDDGCLLISFNNMDSFVRKVFNRLSGRGSKSQYVTKYNINLMNGFAKKYGLKLVKTDYVLQYAFGALGYSLTKEQKFSRLLATNLILSYKKNV